MGDSYHNSGVNYGIVGPVNNYGPQKLTFDQNIASEILKLMPNKKTVILKTIGGRSDQDVGNQYHEFLVSNGFEVQRSILGGLNPPPDNKISFGESENSYTITIAPST